MPINIFFDFSQVKIWFQNKRSKFKKILKQHHPPGMGPAPGNTSLPGMSPDGSDSEDGEHGHSPKTENQSRDGQSPPHGLTDQDPGSMQMGDISGNHMSNGAPGPGNNPNLLPGQKLSPNMGGSPGGSWGDMNSGHAMMAQEHMYMNHQQAYMGQSLPTHPYGAWGYPTPAPHQGSMPSQQSLLT